jgi:hypothetical protein
MTQLEAIHEAPTQANTAIPRPSNGAIHWLRKLNGAGGFLWRAAPRNLDRIASRVNANRNGAWLHAAHRSIVPLGPMQLPSRSGGALLMKSRALERPTEMQLRFGELPRVVAVASCGSRHGAKEANAAVLLPWFAVA